ncbi:conserved hypothetical protein, partial [delta proteobacterium NaphS2]
MANGSLLPHQTGINSPHQLLENPRWQYRLPERGPNPTIGGMDGRYSRPISRNLISTL